jgi:hypothetical protein
LSGFESRRRFLWRCPRRACFRGDFAVAFARRFDAAAGAALRRGDVGVVVGVVGAVVVDVVVDDVVVVVGAGSDVVVVDVDVVVVVVVVVVGSLLVVAEVVVSSVVGGESAKAAATPTAKRITAPTPAAMSFLSAIERIIFADREPTIEGTSFKRRRQRASSTS